MAGPTVPQEFLKAENVGLRMLLEQAGIDAKALLAQAGIEAKEREAGDRLQKLILEELHHRIKNTLATVSAIASQSLRTATSIEHGQQAIESRLLALGRAHDLLMQGDGRTRASPISPAAPPIPMTARGRTILNPGAGPPDYVRRRDSASDDIQRTLHQHHEIRRAVQFLLGGRSRSQVRSMTNNERLHLTWTEKDGPAVRCADPARVSAPG